MIKKRVLLDNFREVSMDTIHNIDLKFYMWSYVNGENRYIQKKYPERPTMTKEMKKDYVSYYKSFGFRNVWTDWAEYIYRVTGIYDRRYVPDDLFNLYIDSPYVGYAQRDAWQNKAFQPFIFPEAKFPEILVKRLNGYYFDGAGKEITPSEVLKLARSRESVVIKHVIGGGGGNINFYDSGEVTEGLLEQKDYDFIIQDLIQQSSFMAQFNEKSVNIIKFTSFLFQGEVHILSTRLWAGKPNSRKSNTSGGQGLIIPLDSDGNLGEYSSNLYGVHRTETPGGCPFKGMNVDFYKECVELIKAGHKRLMYFPFISWDFTQDKDGNVVLIEYNLKYHILYDIQYLTGPVFGDFTDEVLKAAKPAIEGNRGLIF